MRFHEKPEVPMHWAQSLAGEVLVGGRLKALAPLEVPGLDIPMGALTGKDKDDVAKHK